MSRFDQLDLAPRAPSVPSFTTVPNGVTFLIVSAAGVAYEATYDRIQAEIDDGRRVNVIPTPSAARWLDAAEIERVTGWPPRSEVRHPSEPTFSPAGSRVVASPVTLNTLTKWAAGHSDNLAISLLCEAIGTPGLPVVAEISLGKAYGRHPAATAAMATLAHCGVDVQMIKSTPTGAMPEPIAPWSIHCDHRGCDTTLEVDATKKLQTQLEDVGWLYVRSPIIQFCSDHRPRYEDSYGR